MVFITGIGFDPESVCPSWSKSGHEEVNGRTVIKVNKEVHECSPERIACIALSSLMVKSTLLVVKKCHCWLDKKPIGLGGMFLALPFLLAVLRLGTGGNDSQ